MRTHDRHPFTRLDVASAWGITVLIAGLALLPAGRVTAQTLTTLHSFTGSDGAHPIGGLTVAGKGNARYGTTAYGGSGGWGTVFAINTDGTGFTNLYSFTGGSDGANPSSGLVLSGNTLYGTTYNGGSSAGGTVFAINTDGTGFTILHSFTGGSEGANPMGGLILSNNTLHGTTTSGGSSGRGTVFALNTDGTGFTNLHSFTLYDGGSPQAGLILSGNTLYGTTYNGGGSGNGTVFAVNTDGTGFTTEYSFTQEIIPCVNGSCPAGDWCVGGICVPISGSPCLNGSCPAGYQCVGGICVPNGGGGCPSCYPGYCVCVVGMPCYCVGNQGSGGGVVASLDLIPDGGVTAQTFISINFDGANPIGGLILSNDTLYGTAAAGGSSGAGTVFAVHTDGTGFTVLHSFTDASDGADPRAGVILSGNTLYGTAGAGGSFSNGTVFAINTDGTGFTILHSFTGGSEGANPMGGLILSSNTLHGTTTSGGSSGRGTVFSLPLPPLPPVAQCKNVTVSADANCGANASIDDGSFSPNAGDTITLVQSPAGPYPLGNTSVTLTVTDSHGASNSCVATVAVVDTTPPVITCPGNIVTDATSPAGAVVTFSPAASDNCSLAGVASSPASGSVFAIGDTTVSCTATDGAANQAACTFTVHVNGAAEQINNLIAMVKGLGLQPGTANSLIVKLQSAARALDRANIQAACGNLGAFLNEVNAQRGKKLTAAQADLLIAEATRIRDVVGSP